MNRKTLATILGTAVLASGATFALGGETVPSDAKLTNDKQEILKAYIYSQATSGRVPTIDLSYVSTEEVAKAYVEVLKDKGDALADIKDSNLFTRIQTKATERNEMVCR